MKTNLMCHSSVFEFGHNVMMTVTYKYCFHVGFQSTTIKNVLLTDMPAHIHLIDVPSHV
jgi:hypothetical protein